ncbi:MAG: family 20 glycosylhydrolase [Bacteroidetes bacterium]|nr:family 20 glycosylhydrolase [Bacteroidota bacterium]
MRTRNLFFILCFLLGFSKAGFSSDDLSLIPEPVSVIRTTGYYSLPANLNVYIKSSDSNVKSVAQMFLDKIRIATGYKGKISNTLSLAASLSFALNKSEQGSLGNEGYRLSVTKRGIKIIAAQPAGLFYAVQTLLQLLPPEIESKQFVSGKKWDIPLVEIFDKPRFSWRGLMMDVSRHFFTKEEIKKFIDDMAAYKFNLLHLHLTDDDGWRIEIKSYPKLTEIGAWRPDRTGNYTFFTHPEPDAPNNYGGFFTQEDIKEIISYASKNFINVMPEIDVPGHSLAAIAAYPDLACTPGTYRPCSGDSTMVWPKEGGFYALFDNSLCAGKEEVYTFLDKVFTEVAALFPFEYIHVGGDENAKNFWEKSEYIKNLMEKEKIPSIHAVQNYFTRRVEKIIKSKGKKMIGWDEILEGELDPNTAIMSWQGIQGGLAAAKRNLKVVFAPNSYAYYNYMQGDPAIEPPVHASRLLKDAYAAEPVPAGVDASNVLGVEACLWSEQIYTYRHLQYMLWPRGFAAAEWSWREGGKKDWPEFIRRIEKQFVRYDYAQKKYAPSMYEPMFSISGSGEKYFVKMETQVAGVELHYSFDNAYPDRYYPEYKGPVAIPPDASLLRVICYKDGKQVGRNISITIEKLKERLK